jgi:NAD(P)-dependent dehydrogenase (short-subunit alcohol dehydrogenase family)
MTRTWLITGASRGLGRAFAQAALARGDRVAGLARGELPEGVEPYRLDVRDRAAVFAAFEAVGPVDVVVNNAGTMSLGMVEEFDEAAARAAMETNFFGALWVAQAAAARLRSQGSGHLIHVSSIGGVGGHPMTGLYSASKFALEGMAEALAAELAFFGVKSTIVEPGGYWTDLYTRMSTMEPLDAYAPLREELQRTWSEGSVDSDPALAAEALLRLVDAGEPPLRLLLGDAIFDAAISLHEQRIETWRSWESVSRAAERAIPQSAL